MQFFVITKKALWQVKARNVQHLTQALHSLAIEFESIIPLTDTDLSPVE